MRFNNQRGNANPIYVIGGVIILLFLVFSFSLLKSEVEFTGSVESDSDSVQVFMDGKKLTQINIEGDIFNPEKYNITVESFNEIEYKWLRKDLYDNYMYYKKFQGRRGSSSLTIYYKEGYNDFIKDFSKQ